MKISKMFKNIQTRDSKNLLLPSTTLLTHNCRMGRNHSGGNKRNLCVCACVYATVWGQRNILFDS